MFSGAPFPDTVLSINAYLGGFPIAAALAEGADIVVTGRVVDSALILGPLIHEFGWTPTDYDLLAAGTAAAIFWNAARNRPAAPSPIGATCPIGPMPAIRSANAMPMAPSS